MDDLVAAFVAAFHPTQGNVIEWSSTIADSISLQGVEFSSLPSGLHSVEEDVIYFRHDSYDAVSVFRRLKTGEEGRKGIRMEAIGVLLARSSHTRPWLHVPHLKGILDKESLRHYFESHKSSSLTSVLTWQSWPTELSPPVAATEAPASSTPTPAVHPLLHAYHLWDIMGPSFVTIWKFVLARRRVMVYTHAPVEVACHLGRIMVELAFAGAQNSQQDSKPAGAAEPQTQPAAEDSRPPTFMGVVGLIDIPKLERESEAHRGWIACTTDKIFFEKPDLFDLFVDLTAIYSSSGPTSERARSSYAMSLPRPNLYMSRPSSNPVKPSSKSSQFKLQLVRSTFSDLRVWGRCDKSLKDVSALPVQSRISASRGTDEDVGVETTTPVPTLRSIDSRTIKFAQSSASTKEPPAAGWSSVLPWRLYSYEDVCLMCASLWMGEGATCTHGPRQASSGSGRIFLEGDDDALLGRNVATQNAMQKPMVSQAAMDPGRTSRAAKRWSKQAKNRLRGKRSSSTGSSDSKDSSSSSDSDSATASALSPLEHRYGSYDPSIRHTMFMLDAFTDLADGFWAGIDDILRSPIAGPLPSNGSTIYVSYSQMAYLGLSSLSELDSKLIEWLAETRMQSGNQEWRLSVKVRKGWRDYVGALVGW